MASVDLNHINPVSDFVRNYKTYLDRLNQTKTPEVLTVNGKPECVLVDPESYQKMVEAFEQARFITAVNEGIKSMKTSQGTPVEEAFANIKNELGI